MRYSLTGGLLLVILVHITSTTTFADFEMLPGGPTHDGGYGLCFTPLGAPIGIGAGFPPGSYSKDLLLYGPGVVELTSGNVKLYGGKSEDYGYSIQRVGLDYIMVGHTESHGAGRADVWLIKLDRTLNVQWQRTFGDVSDDHGYDVHQTTDGGYIIVGRTNSYGAGKSDVLLIKTRGDGKQEWLRTFGGPEREVGYSVRQTSDGGYILTGYKESEGATDKKVWLIRTNPAGEATWNRVFGGDKDDSGCCVRQVRGGYLVAGSTESFSEGQRDAYIIKTDPGGKTLWEKSFGAQADDCVQYIGSTGEEYVFTGWTWSYEGKPATWLVAIRPDGREITWNRLFRGGAGYYGYCVQQGNWNMYVIAGICTSSDRFARGYDGFLISDRPHAGHCCWYNTFDSRGSELVPDGAWGHINPGDFHVECDSVALTLRNCRSATEPQPPLSIGGAPPVTHGEPQEPAETPRAHLVRLLSSQWIATHRIYTTGDRAFDAVVLSEEPHQLRLARTEGNRKSKYPYPKAKIDKIEPLTEEEIAGRLSDVLGMNRKKFASGQERRWHKDAIKELSERCCKYGAPLPGIHFISLRLDEQTGKLTEAVLEIDERNRKVEVGDTVDGFTVLEYDAETDAVLLRMGEDGQVVRIWSARMWNNLGTRPRVEQMMRAREVADKQSTAEKDESASQDGESPAIPSDSKDSPHEPDGGRSKGFQRLLDTILGPETD